MPLSRRTVDHSIGVRPLKEKVRIADPAGRGLKQLRKWKGCKMDIHLRQTLGTGYGVTREDAALVQALALKYLGKGQQLTLRFDTLKTVSQEFVVSALAGLSDKVSTETIMGNLRLRGFPMDHMLVLEIIIETWFDLPRKSSVVLRNSEAMLKASRLIRS
jgi:hypothetical protein